MAQRQRVSNRKNFALRRRIGRLWALQDRIRENFFVVPACFVVGALLVARLLLALDDVTSTYHTALPFVLSTTVASARSLLSVIAGAIITTAGLVFSITIVALQLIATQYSPRVLSSFLLDPFPQAVMGFMVGTFTYCLVVLREVRGPLSEGGEAIIPSFALTGAIALAIIAALLLLAYIAFAAQAFKVERILFRISNETLATIRRVCPNRNDRSPEPDNSAMTHTLPTARLPGQSDQTYHLIEAKGSGWVHYIDADEALQALPPESILILEVRTGGFLVAGTPLGTLWLPSQADPAERDRVERQVQRAILLGRERTMRHDIAFGLEQLDDIALRALSSGINDPTTAIGAIMHLRLVLRELLLRQLPAWSRTGTEGQRLMCPLEGSVATYIELAIAPVRLEGAGQPLIAISLLETLGLLRREAERHGQVAWAEPLIAQADLLITSSMAGNLLPEDRCRVLEAARAAGFVLKRGGDIDGESFAKGGER